MTSLPNNCSLSGSLIFAMKMRQGRGKVGTHMTFDTCQAMVKVWVLYYFLYQTSSRMFWTKYFFPESNTGWISETGTKRCWH